MSSDNGIYILKTRAMDPLPESDFEYRVAHGMAIENIYYNVTTGAHQKDFIPQEAFRYFGDCQVFTTYLEATLFAHKLAEEYPILEYGVAILYHHSQAFESFSEEELEFYDGGVDDILARHHQKRDVETNEKLKKAEIDFGEGTVFEVGRIFGHLIRPDGTKINGSLSGLRRLRGNGEVGNEDGGFDVEVRGDGVDIKFLPSDWNK